VDAPLSTAGSESGAVAEADLPGIDVARVSSWLVKSLPDLEPPLRFGRIGAGLSAISFRVDDAAGRRLVLRRPPLGQLLASAHDMAREHRILSGLSGAGARVPRALRLCEDPAVTGAPFYAMEYVEGVIPSRVEAAERLSLDARGTTARTLAEALTEFQAIDLDAAGLGDFKRSESLASRQLRRWTRQWHASKTRELPVVEELAERLAERMPEERESVLVHGDYRLDNAVLADDGTVRAMLDWELCTVGDPLADVGLMIAYWNELGSAAGRPDSLFQERVTALPGFPAAGELAEPYARASGRDVAELAFWVPFSFWKITVIVEGVYRRWLNDPANAAGGGGLQAAVDRLAALGQEALDGDGRTVVSAV
jgi:aminoglycoside phosphotransferase (APT) family kinase protein